MCQFDSASNVANPIKSTSINTMSLALSSTRSPQRKRIRRSRAKAYHNSTACEVATGTVVERQPLDVPRKASL